MAYVLGLELHQPIMSTLWAHGYRSKEINKGFKRASSITKSFFVASSLESHNIKKGAYLEH